MDKVRISKTLSFWLRHKPEAAGLSLSSDGWADIDAVLAALASEVPGCGWEELVMVVETSDKQRFELSGDAARIRARQGHSVDVDLDWPQTKPPERLYHGTVARFLDAILAEGLKPMARHHVHLSGDLETANKVAARRGQPVILVVEAAELSAAGRPFLLTSNGVWLVDHVPPEHLSVLD
ncbi:MAG: RNA 2'-phosphotransferase [Caulobacterales bacterium]|nr:RNA 2'-phosphotransferase [Caulobacterales bacterium]